ncbi:BREX-2 system adenine-specific DNA-methyltransferase PglX [Thalassoroseus pseudoceratinae]|uniref:BREX-2 system adenine-specific DNA-methyltransferase PglX n=1 Tax=Thalassoroseus pseudoceratinae TaxID=2713176 RepID=UPI00142366F3|nr:BREX-2 system adenine-specific DNA-methyltransferase PglX [Thalassoroseus pseudoceratinae]
MLDIKTLLPELKKLVTDLSEDLLARSTAKDDPHSAEVDAGLREAYQQIEKGGRTADAFEVWREDYLDQVAVAWVLGCVFVRFMEDNHLIDECWLAGNGDRRTLAEDTHELYFREHPHESDREYFEHVFREVGKIPACRDLFAEGKTPLWAVGPSGDMAMKLLAFWRDVVPETGELQRSFEVEDGDTRFLGDLYQDLSERARKKYALLQTPVFVEEFILDRTLDPAIDEFGLDEVRMIDPTCGSGHFLLGGFARLFELWIKREDNEVVAAQKALDGVWGCDINPFAVAIARFRLIVAALRACGIKRLKDAPAWNIHLATGDSLLFGSRWDREGNKKGEQQFLGTAEESWAPHIYACEDKSAVSEVLGQQYHVVVGNPPYITPKDNALNQAYRDRYSTCHRQYSLAVPFAERFFDLSLSGSDAIAGFAGMITAHSFMKREFGKKLIESFFPTVDLTHIIDTSGAFIPGHTTSTVILFGRNRPPLSDSLRAILGIKGESGTPDDAAQGKVWKSIVRQIDDVDCESAFTSVADMPRSGFMEHPWNLGGGGVSELRDRLEQHCDTTLADHIESIGFMCITKQDDVFGQPQRILKEAGCEQSQVRPFGIGEDVRNWRHTEGDSVIFPYDEQTNTLPPDELPKTLQFMWPYRTVLKNRKVFGGKTYQEAGKPWYEYGQIPRDRMCTPLSIVFAFVATHNHFALDRGGTIYKQSAPIIKLEDTATEDDHLALLGLLNSSLACFWMKQVMTCKGLGGQGGGIKPEHWSRQYEFAGTMMKKCPVPAAYRSLTPLARIMDNLACDIQHQLPESIVKEGVQQLQSRLDVGRRKFESTHLKLVSYQEELDWHVYALFDLCEPTSLSPAVIEEGLHPEHRPVEKYLLRSLQSGNKSIFYDVHSYRGAGQLNDLAPKYKDMIEHRMRIADANSSIRLIEQLDFKRRWQVEPWEKQTERALRNWLIDRLGAQPYWPDPSSHEPRLNSVAELSDRASGDQEFLQVAAVYRGRNDFDVSALVAELVKSESVPFLPILCYKPAGLRKREVWEKMWELQRREDAGEEVSEIKVPPKYKSSDFQSSDNWRLRGKLDVPKERWISFPHCETESDPSLVVGWAGWNHLQQATAIISYYDARKREGWDAKRLTPLLAGLDQLLPWIHQWHPEVDPEFGETAGQSFETMLKADAHELGLTLDDIRAWEPPKKTKTRRKRKTK